MTESRGHNMGRGDSMILTFDVPPENTNYWSNFTVFEVEGTSNVEVIESLLNMGQRLYVESVRLYFVNI